MKNGDISNETPPRIIVLIDVVAVSEMVDTKKLLRTTQEKKITRLNALALKQLWDLGNKYGLSLELAAYESDDWTQQHLDSFMARLDRRGANPFNYAELYTDIDNFIDDLPYRANFKGVIDLPGRVARYGSWGVELENL
jgi:hypothetical protein